MQNAISYLTNKINAVNQLEGLLHVFWNEFYSLGFDTEEEKSIVTFLSCLMKIKKDCEISQNIIILTEKWNEED